MEYKLFVDHDERGEFRAHVEDEKEKTVFEYGTGEEDDEGEVYDVLWLVEDGWMKHGRDMPGLTAYLQGINVLTDDDTIVSGYDNPWRGAMT